MARNLIFRGVISLLFFAVALWMPDATLLGIALAFGLYAGFVGVSRIATAIRLNRAGDSWLLPLSLGLLGVVASVVALMWPGFMLLILAMTVSVWAIYTGLIEIYAAIAARNALPKYRFSVGLIGSASLVLGSILFVAPSLGVLTLLTLVASYALISGLFFLMMGIEERRSIARARFAKNAKPDQEDKRAA